MVDPLMDWHKRKALRQLPRYDPIEGPGPDVSHIGDKLVMVAVLVIFVLIILGIVQ